MNLRAIMGEAGADAAAVEAAVNRILNREVKAAQAAGLKVLFCMGEREEEVDRWDEVLATQVREGLEGVDLSCVRVAYEPVWRHRPRQDAGGTRPISRRSPASSRRPCPAWTSSTAAASRRINAEMLAGIPEIDGGLIALHALHGGDRLLSRGVRRDRRSVHERLLDPATLTERTDHAS